MYVDTYICKIFACSHVHQTVELTATASTGAGSARKLKMQTIRSAQPSVRSAPVRTSVKCNASIQQVKPVPRRELLTAGATFAAVLFGAGAAKAAGESSATRAITAVTRPQQLKQKNDNRAALKDQVEKVRKGEADPKSLP